MSIPMRSESLPKAESLWTSPRLDHLGKAILCTVAYADVFDYPLTAAQIHRYLMGTATSRDRVNRALRADPWVRQRLEEHEGYYTLPGREDLVKLRQNRARVASGMWPREALALAQAGRHVLATDVSPEMAAQTANRARAADLSHRVRALCVPAGGLAALRPDTPFDGAYASFGALNCEPHLGRA
jgi:hypothetical protein